jgi:hypothetical protein
MAPLIYFSYGMTKSGSTLSFELARAALVLSGQPQPMLSEAAVLKRKRINFCDHIDADRADAIRRETKAHGHMIAIKTHTRPDPSVISMLNSGEALAHATYRDPRDIALSMLDHGIKSRQQGKQEFTEFHKTEDTVDELRHQTNTLLAWLSLPNVRPLYYDDLAFDMAKTASRIASDLDVDVDPADVMSVALHERGTQKNKAVPNRHMSEMSDDMNAHFRSVFSPMYEKLIDRHPDLPNDGRPLLDPKNPLCDWSQSATP